MLTTESTADIGNAGHVWVTVMTVVLLFHFSKHLFNARIRRGHHAAPNLFLATAPPNHAGRTYNAPRLTSRMATRLPTMPPQTILITLIQPQTTYCFIDVSASRRKPSSGLTSGAGRQYVKACPIRASTGSSPRLDSCCRSSWSIWPPLWVDKQYVNLVVLE